MARWLALGAFALLLLAPAAARADSIVYQRDGDVWIMAPDGSGQRAVTHGGAAFEWPSEADNGTIVAGDGTGLIYRMTQRGAALGAPLATPDTTAGEDDDDESPTHIRISPDASMIAFDEVIDGETTTLWTPANATAPNYPNQSVGQEDLGSPAWIGNAQLALTRDVIDDPDDSQFALYGIGGGDDSATAWFDDPGDAWATELEATVSRDGSREAVLEDDAALNGGTPTRLALRIFVSGQFRCELDLPPEGTYDQASPTLSPSGARLAWAQADGIHVATLGALTDCGAIQQSTVTAPGAWEPSFSAATDATPSTAPPAAGAGPLTLAIRTRVHPLRSTVLRRGIAVKVSCSAACVLRLTLRHGAVAALATRKLSAAGAITIRLKLRSRAVRELRRGTYPLALRVTAPGAVPVTKTIRPRG